MTTGPEAIPDDLKVLVDEGVVTLNRLYEIVEKLDAPLPTLVDAVAALSRDDLEVAFLVAVLAIVGKRAERSDAQGDTE